MIYLVCFLLILFCATSIAVAVDCFHKKQKILSIGYFIIGCAFIYELIHTLCDHFVSYLGGL